MRIPRIFCPKPLTAGSQITLDAAASNHLLNVLRLKLGASLQLFNDNSEYSAEIIHIEKRLAVIMLKDSMPHCPESPLRIHLMQGIARGEKMDWVLQKSVELGVAEITPVFTERCGVELTADRLAKRMQHWQSVIIHACEQSGRQAIPILHGAVNLTVCVQQAPAEVNLILHPQAKTALADIAQQPNSVKVLIGPEGGLSDAEIQLAKQNHFMEIQLGPRILRTETAPLAVIAVLQYRWGDLS